MEWHWCLLLLECHADVSTKLVVLSHEIWERTFAAARLGGVACRSFCCSHDGRLVGTAYLVVVSSSGGDDGGEERGGSRIALNK